MIWPPTNVIGDHAYIGGFAFALGEAVSVIWWLTGNVIWRSRLRRIFGFALRTAAGGAPFLVGLKGWCDFRGISSAQTGIQGVRSIPTFARTSRFG